MKQQHRHYTINHYYSIENQSISMNINIHKEYSHLFQKDKKTKKKETLLLQYKHKLKQALNKISSRKIQFLYTRNYLTRVFQIFLIRQISINLLSTVYRLRHHRHCIFEMPLEQEHSYY